MKKFVYIIALCSTLIACSRSIAVVSEFPTPVITPAALHAGIRYPAELTDFTHVEDPLLEPEWTIRLGEANVRMFRTMFSALFTEVTELTPGESGSEGNTDIDIVIEPKLEELEFSVPRQTNTDQYVVWLRYNLKFLLPDGAPISDWRVTGYGQQDEGDFGLGAEAAMRQAAVLALRDAAANIVIGFAQAPGIQDFVVTQPATADNQAAENDEAEDATP